ncbi:uncharacterized protein LOC111023023 [Momordica charantia]|uniref:Uncharacterized protein LOC111023023 n=1 Tax=Momordica charantia TaxID=3673 RepID=A0A6J1DS59_MOMCH|nr:uncharacterized protein LOC111023023 [Momordica charantia]
MALLPKYVGLRSLADDLYLRFVKEDVQIHGYVKYDSHDVVTPYTKYEVEPAKVGKRYVNIRCCYSNKYWVRPSMNSRYVVAAADEPNEDESNWSCTLFEPIHDSGNQAYRIKHVQLGFNTCSSRDGSIHNECLFIMTSSAPPRNFGDLHIVMDWESFFIFPKHVAFKGGNRGKFLKAIWLQRHEYQEFSANDMADPAVGNEVSFTRHGDVRIKSNHFGKFWRLSPNWIWADSTDPTANNKHTLFKPVKVANNIVALRNLGNNHFCIGLTTEGKTDCLNAWVSTITNEARMEIHELVLSRSIYNVDFHLFDARIYGENIIAMANGNAVNNTNEPNTITIRFSYTNRVTNTWSSTLSAKLGVKATFRAGIPVIAQGRVTISAEFSGEYTWGETRETTDEIETTHTVVVPPMTKMTVSLLATQGYCDVPFSYYQRDVLMNGETVIELYEDGLYTGANCYNFKYEAKDEPL